MSKNGNGSEMLRRFDQIWNVGMVWQTNKVELIRARLPSFFLIFVVLLSSLEE